jgi:predicted DNA-binding transcriptional regulator AlpA
LTLRKWRVQKRGPQYIKIGALVRYRPEDVDAWIAEQQSPSVALSEAAR